MADTAYDDYNDYNDYNADGSVVTDDTDATKQTTCEKIGKKTCTTILAVVVIFLLIAICWWLFQICSSGNTDDPNDESPMCQMLGDIGQLLGDFAATVATILNNLGWLLAIGVLYGIYKLLDLFGINAKKVEDKETDLQNSRNKQNEQKNEDNKNEDKKQENNEEGPDSNPDYRYDDNPNPDYRYDD